LIYAFIDEERRTYPVVRLCHALNVSSSGYYAWRKRPPSTRDLANQALLVRIREAHTRSRQTYGSPRIHAELVVQGKACGRHRVARLMRKNEVRAWQKRPYRVRTTRVDAALPIAPNRLAQSFETTAMNQTWLGDITYVATAEGWLYLAAVMDLHSRRILGWSTSDLLTTPLALSALQMALGRRPSAGNVVHHTDRGSQYASADYRAALAAHGLLASMSRSGNCYDNAPMESFFATLKSELIHRRAYRTREEARQDLVAYIEGFYNATRRHSALGYCSPMEFERLAIVA